MLSESRAGRGARLVGWWLEPGGLTGGPVSESRRVELPFRVLAGPCASWGRRVSVRVLGRPCDCRLGLGRPVRAWLLASAGPPRPGVLGQV